MASSSDGEAYKGYFNRVNLALGTSLIVLAGACVVIGLVTGWWTAVQIAGIVVGLPAGLIVTAGAFGNAKRQVVVSAEGVALDGELVPWAQLEPAQELEIIRRTPFFTRRIRQLRLGGEMMLSDEWLKAPDYEAVRERVADHASIETLVKTES